MRPWNDHAVAIEATEVRKSFDGTFALDGLSLRAWRGECLALLGPNGAGKSTLARAITGTAPFDSGSIVVLGHDVARAPRAVKERIGLVPQDDNLDVELTALENLMVFARFFGAGTRQAFARARELLDEVRLADKAHARVDQLSGGMRRRLLIARALVGRPELLVLDEPTTGLDPAVRREIWEQLRALKRAGVTLLLTTHYMEEAERLAEHVAVLSRGRVVASGTPRAVTAAQASTSLEDAYLRLVSPRAVQEVRT